MPTVPNVSPGNVRGLVGKLVGVYEEIVGSLLSNDRLKKRGQLHQKAADKRLDALEHGAKAAKHEATATAAEQGERTAQKSKQTA
ncbi:MAG TPA: hypothetical protein VF288_08760 [Mycobacteriales bacterium]